MPSFLLELYLPRSRGVEEVAALAQGAAAAATRGGSPVRYVRSMHLAEDETCFVVFEAPSREVLLEAAHRTGLTEARVIEAVEVESVEPS
jgi:Nickel responsive protein SCO4226-like